MEAPTPSTSSSSSWQPVASTSSSQPQQQTASRRVELLDPQQLTRIGEIFSITVSQTPTPSEQRRCFEAVISDCEEGRWDRLEKAKSYLSDLTPLDGCTPLEVLRQRRRGDVIQQLCEKGLAGPLSGDEFGTYLHRAAREGWTDLIEVLCPYIDYEERDQGDRTPIHGAIEGGQHEALNKLLQGASPVSRLKVPFGQQGKTLMLSPLAYAVVRGEIACIDVLIQSGADLSTRVAELGNLLHTAVHFRQHDVLRHLLYEYGDQLEDALRNSNQRGQTPISLAASIGNVEAIEELYGKGADLNAGSDQGWTPLHWAAAAQQWNAIRLLLFLGADPNGTTHKQELPIHLVKGDNALSKQCSALLANTSREQELGKYSPPDFSRRPPKNLSFQGGDSPGSRQAFVGALLALQEKGLLTDIERVTGTSLGAAVALLLALGVKPQSLAEELAHAPLYVFQDMVPEQTLSESITAFWRLVTGNEETASPLEKGKHVDKRLLTWLEELIEKKTHCKNCTFGELKAKIGRQTVYKHLYLYVIQIDKELEFKRFSSEDETCQDYLIADVAYAALSIPGVYKPHAIRRKDPDGKLFGSEQPWVEASLWAPAPVCTFDEISFNGTSRRKPQSDFYLYNKRTLGITVSSHYESHLNEGQLHEFLHHYRAQRSFHQQPGPYDRYRVITVSDALQSPLHTSPGWNKRGRDSVGEFLRKGSSSKRTSSPLRGQRIVPGAQVWNDLNRVRLQAPPQVPWDLALPIVGLLGQMLKRSSKILLWNLDLPHPDFMGREGLLNDIATAFFSEHKPRVVLWGDPGVGKTELACTFANRFKSHFSLIAWIDGGKVVGDRNLSYRGLYKRLQSGKITKEHSSAEIRQSLFHMLENDDQTRPWLLIYDNVEEKKLETPKRGGHVLLTSRRTDLGHHSQRIRVNSLSPLAARTMLEQLTRQSDRNNSTAVVHELGYSPLAIDKAAAFINEEKITIREYFEELRTNVQRLLKQKGENARYPLSLEATWDLSLSRLRYPSATEWLRVCAFFNASEIPLSWLQHWLKEQKRDKTATETARNIQHKLKVYGLVRLHNKHKTFSLHALERQILQAKCSDRRTEHLQAFMFLMRMGRRVDRNRPVKLLHLGKYWLPHAMAVISHPLAQGQKAALIAEMHEVIGCIKQTMADDEGALKHYEAALQGSTKGVAVPPSKAIFLENQLAGCLNRLSRFDDALVHCENAQQKYHELPVQLRNRLSIADSLFEMTRALAGLGKNQEGLKKAQEALKIVERYYGDRPHPDIAEGLHVVGTQFQRLNYFQQAITDFERALTIWEQNPKEQREKHARTLNNLGVLYKNTGDFARAHNYHRRALEVLEGLYGTKWAAPIALSLAGMGNVKLGLKQYDQAERLHRKALKIWEKVYRHAPHIRLASSLHQVGKCCLKKGKYAEALNYFQQTRATLEALFGKRNHKIIASTLNSIGYCYEKLGKHRKAMSRCKQALAKLEKLQDERPLRELAGCLDSLGTISASLGFHRDAVAYSRRQIGVLRDIYEHRPHRLIAKAYEGAALSLAMIGESKEALAAYESALQELYRIGLGEHDPKILRTKYLVRFLQEEATIASVDR